MSQPQVAPAHVLIDARPLNGQRNGLARFVEQMVREWPMVSGAKVTLISHRPIQVTQALPASLAIHVDGGIWRRCPGSLWFNLRAGVLARRLGATHVLGTQHVLPLFGLRGVHRGVIVHDLVFRKFPNTMLWSDRLLSWLFVPLSLKAADSVFCVSESTRQDLLREFAVDPHLTRTAYPGGTFDALASPRVAPLGATVRLLVVGSIEPRKNLAQFFRVFRILRRQGHALELDIVSGMDWGGAIAPELWRAMESDPLVRVHRAVDDERLQRLYEAADCLVFPSLYEGFGLPMLEAVGKCAVIANDIPVFREIAAHLEGVILIDFEAQEEKVAVDLAAVLARRSVARFRTEPDRELFSWRNCARVIAAGMGLGAPSDGAAGQGLLTKGAGDDPG
ncbi:MAG: glycosyltransferase family 1 protein [Hylemonella sp.]|nr:glycosyltransferase family 1 protein [Hylemonella sp.]